MKVLPAVGMALVALAADPAAALDDAELLRLSQSVLRIEAPLPQGGFAMGSGVALSADTVITNCHVTRSAKVLNVVRGGVRYSVAGQVSAIEQDLCLLRVPGLGATAAMLGEATSLRIGGPVAALGYTGGVGMQRSRGEVLSLHRFQDAPVIRSSTWFNSGASGGALFSEDGQLVGLLTFRLRGGLAHYYAAPAEWIKVLQGRASVRGYDAVAPLPGAPQPYWQVPSDQQPRFLQAASLSLAQRWQQVAHLAIDWLRADATDAEAWQVLGDALEHTGTPEQSSLARACAKALARGPTKPASSPNGADSTSTRAESSPRAAASLTSTGLPTPCPVVS